MINSRYSYPDPGSNRDGLLHRCLRPARLPIPPSGLDAVQRYADFSFSANIFTSASAGSSTKMRHMARKPAAWRRNGASEAASFSHQACILAPASS